jgi:hypothetical protein
MRENAYSGKLLLKQIPHPTFLGFEMTGRKKRNVVQGEAGNREQPALCVK